MIGSCSKMSKEVFKKISYYYYELYRNYEFKITSEIANELGVSEKVIRIFQDLYLSTNEGAYTKIGMIIMLCTNFNSMSSYYEMQQKVYGDMIKQRVIMRESKDKHDKIVRLVKEKTKAYMEKRRSM